jgi:hypothetical protein
VYWLLVIGVLVISYWLLEPTTNSQPFDSARGTAVNSQPFDSAQGTAVNSQPFDSAQGTAVNSQQSTVNNHYDFISC